MRTSIIKAAAVGLATSALAIGSAFAAPINLMGYTGPISIDFHDYESFTSSTLAPGDMNFGTFNVINITAQANDPAAGIVAGQTIWSPGGSNGFLVGVFNGITVETVTPNGIGGFTTENTGGTFQLYQTSAFPSFSQGTTGYTAAGCGIGTLCYNGITNTGSGPVLTFNLIPGADIVNPTSTLQANVSGTTVPVSGSAQGYADLTGGSDEGQFGMAGFTTAIGTPADLSLLDNFCANQAGCSGAIAPIGNWQQLSNDPIGAAVIPEPSSLLILGSGLLGLGFLRRRRRA